MTEKALKNILQKQLNKIADAIQNGNIDRALETQAFMNDIYGMVVDMVDSIPAEQLNALRKIFDSYYEQAEKMTHGFLCG